MEVQDEGQSMKSQSYNQDVALRGFVLPSMLYHLLVEGRDHELHWVATCVRKVPFCLTILASPCLVTLWEKRWR